MLLHSGAQSCHHLGEVADFFRGRKAYRFACFPSSFTGGVYPSVAHILVGWTAGRLALEVLDKKEKRVAGKCVPKMLR